MAGIRRQAGFSLLEVMVAFSILALTMGVLMQIFSRALTTTAKSGEYSRAATLAESRLNAVGNEIPLEVGLFSGEPQDGLSWQVYIEPYEPVDVTWEPTLEAYRVTSVASWGDGSDGRRQVSLTTLRLAGADEAGLAPQRTSTQMVPR
jgi:general secretion pathway protein I